MTALRVSIVGTKRLERALKRMDPKENARILRSSLREMAKDLLKNAAMKQIAHGRGKAAPLPTRLTNRHGGRGLVGSIRINEAPLPRAIEVGTDLAYGAVHEEGRGRYPRRACSFEIWLNTRRSVNSCTRINGNNGTL